AGRLPLRRTDRRPRGGHRRAGRVPRDRRVPRVKRRVPSCLGSSLQGVREPGVEDATRRTRLANERTYLAWWRTGLTSLAVSLAAGKVVPQLSGSHSTWPYQLVGAGFAVLGVACIGYGLRRERQIEAALMRGEFVE